MLRITLKKSTNKCTRQQLSQVRGLGLKKPWSSRVLVDTPAIRGMIKKVIHLLEVEENVKVK
jgi:large subunit ribosomal protein L30